MKINELKAAHLVPRNLIEVLASAQAADIVDWHALTKTLSLTFDDHSADRRTCLCVLLAHQRVEICTLMGYNAKKNQWGGYCSPRGTINFADRRGEKALLNWLRAEAIKQDANFPNPQSLTIYRQK